MSQTSGRPKSKGNLPPWTSWKWAKKYLPAELHTAGDALRLALGTLRRTKFADAGSSTPVILGLGLLLRECWRAVEVEPDSGTPTFLVNSLLGVERAEDVLAVIKQILQELAALADVQAVQGATEEEGDRGTVMEAEQAGKGQEREEDKETSSKVRGIARTVTVAPDPSPFPQPPTRSRSNKANESPGRNT